MSPVDPAFSRDNTSATSVSQNIKTAAEMVSQTTPVNTSLVPIIYIAASNVSEIAPNLKKYKLLAILNS